MWKSIALLALSIIRKRIKLNGEQELVWQNFLSLVRSV